MSTFTITTLNGISYAFILFLLAAGALALLRAYDMLPIEDDEEDE